ncbi:hypothetical protein PVAG01_09040 [Phlyctema vagabunda]|uniref:Uncharacterized protein n=1 Tax=Phlyctema vagabunda TaxID=108571 RepID=A0ABR4P680_9HELO
MPAIPPTALLQTLVEPNGTIAANSTDALKVICAWPVSGQYGPGSRVLYYVLIAACVFARKSDWLRNASLAAALLFPAVAAVHGIVLAALHVDGAVDMDVFGAFQLCSIGILAAPVTVRLSKTYFYDPGRNLIFMWTGLILAGLLSLTVEFFRIETSRCPQDNGVPISPDASKFPYQDTTCGLDCSIPSSPLRAGAASNIYVIPAPDKLTFETALLLAAACCIPAILSLISMWNKILKINWKTRFADRDDDEPIQGTNGATNENMRKVNGLIRDLLSGVEIPVFGAAVLAILIVGERNFFSAQVKYETEPIASIGQWAPIIGSGLAVLGSFYVLLATAESEKEEKSSALATHCNCSMQNIGLGISTASSNSIGSQRPSFSHHSSPNMERQTPGKTPPGESVLLPAQTPDTANRRKVAKALTWVGSYIGTAARDRFDDSEFRRGKAVDFPEIPGEEHRNKELPRIRKGYNPSRDADGNVTPALRAQHSRSGSFTSVISRFDIEGTSMTRVVSPQSLPLPQSPLPSPPLPTTQRPRTSTLHGERDSSEVHRLSLSTSASATTHRPPARRDTLEVPSPVHHSYTTNNRPTSPMTSMDDAPMAQPSPTIVVSPDFENFPSAQIQIVHSPRPSSPSEPLSTPPVLNLPP